MKIVIDYDLCEANAVCMETCPESLRKKVEEAVRLCPRQAISIVED
jgi:ferredoxin